MTKPCALPPTWQIYSVPTPMPAMGHKKKKAPVCQQKCALSFVCHRTWPSHMLMSGPDLIPCCSTSLQVLTAGRREKSNSTSIEFQKTATQSKFEAHRIPSRTFVSFAFPQHHSKGSRGGWGAPPPDSEGASRGASSLLPQPHARASKRYIELTIGQIRSPQINSDEIRLNWVRLDEIR